MYLAHLCELFWETAENVIDQTSTAVGKVKASLKRLWGGAGRRHAKW